jgi:hypothetical protein
MNDLRNVLERASSTAGPSCRSGPATGSSQLLHRAWRDPQRMKPAQPNARDTAEPALPGRWYRPP